MHYIFSKYADLLILSVMILTFITIISPYLLNNYNKLRDLVMFFFTSFTFINILSILIFYNSSGATSLTLIRILNHHLNISFNVEPIGLIFAVVSSLLWVVTTIYSSGYVRNQNTRTNLLVEKDLDQVKFYSFMSLSMFFVFGIAFSSNLLTLFVFYELLTISTYPLITESGTDHAKKAGRKYLLILLMTSMILLMPSIAYIYHEAGTLSFTQGGILTGKMDNFTTAILFGIMILGTSKIAIMPLHKWLVHSMVAPAPVSALLHSVAVVNAGIFSVAKFIVYIFGIDNLSIIASNFKYINNWLVYLSCFTIVCSAIIASKQDNIKRMLAYSTIGQLSYSLLALFLFSPKAMIAAIVHIVAHSVSKIGLFFAAGKIYITTGKTERHDTKGLWYILPSTVICFIISAVSLVGIPPLAIFYSKYQIISASLGSKFNILCIVSIFMSTIITTSYYFPIIYRFFEKNEELKLHNKPSKTMNIAIIISAFLTLTFIICSQPLLAITKRIIFD